MHGGDALGVGEEDRPHDGHIPLGHDVAVTVGGVDVARVDAFEVRLDAARLDATVFLHGLVAVGLAPCAVGAPHGRARPVGPDEPAAAHLDIGAATGGPHGDAGLVLGAALVCAAVPDLHGVGQQPQEPIVEQGAVHVGEPKRAGLLYLAVPVVIAEVHPGRVEDEPARQRGHLLQEPLGILVEHAAAALAPRQARALHEKDVQACVMGLPCGGYAGRPCPRDHKVELGRNLVRQGLPDCAVMLVVHVCIP